MCSAWLCCPARSRDWSESGARRLPIGPHAQATASLGLLAALGFCGLRWRCTEGTDARAAPRPTGPGVQGLISAGSWRPVSARAPQPNSMAIVRRPLCSGGGHFLQDRAGCGWQETKIRRPAWAWGPVSGARLRPRLVGWVREPECLLEERLWGLGL